MKVAESLQYFQNQGRNSIVLQKYYMFLEMTTDCDFFSNLIGMPLPLFFHFAHYEHNQMLGFQSRKMMT